MSKKDEKILVLVTSQNKSYSEWEEPLDDVINELKARILFRHAAIEYEVLEVVVKSRRKIQNVVKVKEIKV